MPGVPQLRMERLLMGPFEQAEIIDGHVWQSSLPMPGDLDATNIEILVHCAYGIKPQLGLHKTVSTLHIVELDDNGPPKPEESRLARDMARIVAHHMKTEPHRRINVNCLAGLNRSGWVLGLALRLGGMSGRDAVKLLRARRGPSVLCNEWFEYDVLRGDL